MVTLILEHLNYSTFSKSHHAAGTAGSTAAAAAQKIGRGTAEPAALMFTRPQYKPVSDLLAHGTWPKIVFSNRMQDMLGPVLQ